MCEYFKCNNNVFIKKYEHHYFLMEINHSDPSKVSSCKTILILVKNIFI